MPEELSRNPFDVILQHGWSIDQSLLHIRVFFGGKKKNPCSILFIHWLIKQITTTYRNNFSRTYENRSKLTSRADYAHVSKWRLAGRNEHVPELHVAFPWTKHHFVLMRYLRH